MAALGPQHPRGAGLSGPWFPPQITLSMWLKAPTLDHTVVICLAVASGKERHSYWAGLSEVLEVPFQELRAKVRPVFG